MSFDVVSCFFPLSMLFVCYSFAPPLPHHSVCSLRALANEAYARSSGTTGSGSRVNKDPVSPGEPRALKWTGEAPEAINKDEKLGIPLLSLTIYFVKFCECLWFLLFVLAFAVIQHHKAFRFCRLLVLWVPFCFRRGAQVASVRLAIGGDLWRKQGKQFGSWKWHLARWAWTETSVESRTFLGFLKPGNLFFVGGLRCFLTYVDLCPCRYFFLGLLIYAWVCFSGSFWSFWGAFLLWPA